jgi:HTH-type transcriptional regulator/antitoxin HigA
VEDELPLALGAAADGPLPPPGEFIRAELEKRGWGQAELAKVIGRPLPTVNEIIQGKRAILPEMAVALGAAFGTGALVWLQRESAYRLSLVEQNDPETRARARLYGLAPVKDMERRGWIAPTRRARELEAELCRFFGVASLEEAPRLDASARQPSSGEEFTAAQRAWLFRAAQLAATVPARPFEPRRFEAGLSRLRALAGAADNVPQVPGALAELGVRFMVVEPLPRTRLDGAAFWLREDQPAIALSLRYDRIDWFWHTLAHELSHVRHGDKRSLDANLVGESRVEPADAVEARAEREGAAWLIPPERLRSFILRTRPFYAKEKLQRFALRQGVHPGIVSGQLQHLKELGWDAHRDLLAKVRERLVRAAPTDGWGQAPLPLPPPPDAPFLP